VEAFHFAAGGGVVRPGMLLGYAEPAEFGLETVDGEPPRLWWRH
jgi:hypothetical protein